ncbi:iron reductase domain protein [Cadophora sp. DSE1049]|nr:iron reductase domain protein [Cadophora sp. DSE1049]
MQLLLLFVYLAIFASSAVATNRHSQYCYSSESVPSSFCVSFARSENHTSQGIDLYLAFSALPTSVGGGWTAIGTGESMAGSLMFILWADRGRENVAVSVRTATAHTEPFAADDLPQVDVLRAKASKYASHEVLLVCYSCDKWESLDFQEKSQPWIWASNYFTEFQTADPNQHLGDHQLHDVFYVDMTALPLSHSSGHEKNLPTIQGVKNSGTWDQPLPPSSSSRLCSGFRHGVVMLVAFMGIMMPSAIYKRWKPNTSSHMWSQIAATVLSLIGILLGISASSWRSSPFGIHQTLGLITYCLIILQIFFGAQIRSSGYRGDAPSYRSFHRWLGRSIFTLGISDAGLGLRLAGSSTTTLILLVVSIIGELLLYFFINPGSGSEMVSWRGMFRYPCREDERERVALSEEAADLADVIIDGERDAVGEMSPKSHQET